MRGKPGERLAEHGGNLRKASEKYGMPVDGWLDFSANINPLGLAESVRKTILQKVENIVNYPDPGARECKQAIAAYYALPFEQIVMGNGAVELIYLLMHILRPRRVLLPAPAFSEYERSVRSIGGEIVYFPLREAAEFRLDVPGFIDLLRAVDMCFLCNPHNPVGNLLSREELERIIAAAAHLSVPVVLDESFVDFLPDSGQITCRQLVSNCDNLIIIHSLTKFFAVPGLRLGFGIMPSSLAKLLESAKDPWNVNTLAQSAAVTALRDKQYIGETVRLIGEEKEFLYTELSTISGLKPYRPVANFLFVRLIHERFNAVSLADATARRGILIRDCSNYAGLDDKYIRVAVKQRADNRRLLSVLRDLLA